MNIRDCIERGLLRKCPPDINKAKRSLDVARYKLAKARLLSKKGFHEDAVVKSYSAIFHAARALLFRDGFDERSHYGLYVYLSEIYRDKLEPRFLNELNNLRLERHEILYALEEPTITNKEAEYILNISKDFIEAAEKLVRVQ